MKKYISIFIGCLVISFSILFASCKKKKESKNTSSSAVTCNGSNASYNSNIKAIINNNCVGCHGQYNTFAGLQSSLNDGSFAREVLTNKTMPKGRSISNEDLSIIQCWKEKGYPEN